MGKGPFTGDDCMAAGLTVVHEVIPQTLVGSTSAMFEAVVRSAWDTDAFRGVTPPRRSLTASVFHLNMLAAFSPATRSSVNRYNGTHIPTPP